MKTTAVFATLKGWLTHSLQHQIVIENFSKRMNCPSAPLFPVLQGRELVRKWYHIEAGAGFPVRATLCSAVDQSEVLWSVWCLHEAACLREAPLHLLFPELGGHGQSLLDQTVHWGTEQAHILKHTYLKQWVSVLGLEYSTCLGGFSPLTRPVKSGSGWVIHWFVERAFLFIP